MVCVSRRTAVLQQKEDVMKTGKKVWMDGELILWEKATIHVSAHVVHYGSSAFEGIRAYDHPAGPAVFRLPEHMERLANSCRLTGLQLPYTTANLSDAVCEVIRANGLPSCYIRPVVLRGSETFSLDGRSCPIHVSIMAIDLGKYLGEDSLEKGVRVSVSSWRRLAPGTALPAAKIGGQYVNSQFIAMEAHDRGFDEGVALDIHGFVSEGSGENIFLVRDGVISTPPPSASILNGITRQTVMTLASEIGCEVQSAVTSRDDLYLADELFFTGTAAEISPIIEVDGYSVGDGRPGPVTRHLAKAFFDIVEGRVPDRHAWLTHVQ